MRTYRSAVLSLIASIALPGLAAAGSVSFRSSEDALKQGIAAFTALQAKGIDSRLLRFPDENHWVLKPQNSRMWHSTVFQWLDGHIGKGGK